MVDFKSVYEVSRVDMKGTVRSAATQSTEDCHLYSVLAGLGRGGCVVGFILTFP